MVGVSVIIPFVNEYPSIRFTVQSIVNALEGEVDYEIILINNYCGQVAAQGFAEDKSAEYFQRIVEEGRTLRIKLLSYTEKLSHWNAKMVGVRAAQYPLLFFCDAHVLVPPQTLLAAISKASLDLVSAGPDDHGSYHLPVTYLNDGRASNQLIYRMRYNEKIGMLHYTFHRLTVSNTERVPCMSSCGMVIAKDILLDKLGGWPSELGIYGGGENFINFCLGVLGLHVCVVPGEPLCHLDDNRGYHFTNDDWLRNRMIAIYLAGGKDWLHRCVEGMAKAQKFSYRRSRLLEEEMLDDDELAQHRFLVKSHAVKTLDEFVDSWKSHPLAEQVEEWQ